MTSRFLRATLVALLSALALSGCVRVLADTTLGSDDTYSQHVIVAFNDEIRAQLGDQAGVNVDGFLDDAATDPAFTDLQERFPGQVLLTEYTSGELKGIELTITDLPLAEYQTAASEATASFGGQATVERMGDEFVVVFGAQDVPDIGDVAGVSPGLLESAIEFDIIFTFPGPVVSATAGEVDGNTVRLGFSDVAGGDEIRIVGAASDQINWAPILRWGLIVLAVVVVVGGATALIIQDVRKRRRTTLPEPTDASPAAPPRPGEAGYAPEERPGPPTR